MGKNAFLTCDTLAVKFREKHATMSWENIGREYMVSGGLIYRIAMRDYEPRTPKIRERLGMMPLPLALVPACPVCGEGHPAKGCPNKAKAQPRRSWVRCAGHAGGHYE